MIRQDDRDANQQTTHTLLVVGTDRCLSGWGGAACGASFAAWACQEEDLQEVTEWVERRSDMSRVRVVIDRPGMRYRASCAHLHIYVVGPDDPARGSNRQAA